MGGRFERGSSGATLIAIDAGRSSISLPAPDGFEARSLAHTRLLLSNLPLPLPLTRSVADNIVPNAAASPDGLLVITSAQRQWDFDLRLPSAAEALPLWARDLGFDVARSRDGLDATAVLERLGGVREIETIADAQRFAVLRALAPRSRVKLARRMVREAADAGMTLDEATITDQLSNVGVFLEIEARTAAEIASNDRGRSSVSATSSLALAPLVDHGLVVRARQVACPRCRYETLLDLTELDERVHCRACRTDFALPVTDSGGDEPSMHYRLDGLTARAMDQDVLPVRPTLRAVHPGTGQPFFAWLGVEFTADGGTVDVDLLVSDASRVWCYEVKHAASGLGRRQLDSLLDLSSRLGAAPGIAAACRTFDEELIAAVEGANGRVLHGDDPAQSPGPRRGTPRET